MRDRPFPIPSWAPAAAALAIVAWAASIWWMVATLPTGGDTGDIERALNAMADDVAAANDRIGTLTEQVAAIEAERDALAARVDDLESRGPVEGAFQLSGAEADAEEAAEVAPEDHPLFTDGADRYNCRHFDSYEQAQEALAVNGPGDPNRIDMNRNGVACEDFRYPTLPSSAASSE